MNRTALALSNLSIQKCYKKIEEGVTAKRRQLDAEEQTRKNVERELFEMRSGTEAQLADAPTSKEEDDAVKQWEWQNSLKKIESQLKAVRGN